MKYIYKLSTLSFIFVVLSFSLPLSAQTVAIAAAGSCEDAQAVCFTKFTANLRPIPPIGIVFPGCPANSLDNPDWYAFIPETSNLKFSITTGSCLMGGGIQVGIYDNCGTPANFLGGSCPCTLDNLDLAISVIPGNTYYLVVDGCAGDVCEYTVEVVDGSLKDPLNGAPLQELAPIEAPNEICEGATFEVSVPAVTGSLYYNWSVNGATVLEVMSENKLLLAAAQGSGNIALEVFASNGCGGSNAPVSKQIIIQPSPISRDTQYVNALPGNQELDSTMVAATTGCDTLKITRYIVISSNYQLGTATLEVYPNPAQSTIWIAMKGSNQAFEFRLIHPQGSTLAAFTAQEVHALDVAAFPRGYYWLQCIHPSGEQLTIPLVLQ
jgi:hypothetical protein